MFWADELLQDIKGKQVINDSFTPSGMVHMGSLKGPVIHDVLHKVLKGKGIPVTFKYGFDDMDVIDGLAPNLRESHSKYLGVPLFLAPAPSGEGSFADYFRKNMEKLLSSLDIKPLFYRTSELYKSGTFNRAIRHVLDHVEEVRNVYGEIYKKTIPDTWYPVQVICPKCGKLGTTKVTGWDEKNVSFECKKDLVKWAEGCGYTGEISPFDGNSKMLLKVEWAAKWWTFPVTIEGAGKDHASAGGSYDVAMKLVSNVFKLKQPLKLAYEFFLSGGKKMSSSKGLGLTGEALLEAMGPQRSRFLMIKSPPNQTIEFTPKESDSIPKVFDDYQLASKATDEKKRAFDLSQIADSVEKVPSIRFATLAQWVQMPNMNDEIKKEGLEEWAKYARVWVEKYAPESEKFEVTKELSESVMSLSSDQKQYLSTIAEELHQFKDAQELHKRLYEVATGMGLSSKDAFAAIYEILIGKDHGPKAAWLILSLDKEFVKKRFLEVSQVSMRAHSTSSVSTPRSNLDGIAASSTTPRNDDKRFNKQDIFLIDKDLSEKYPSISIGIAVIKGVSIEKSNPLLEKEKEELLKSFEGLTTEQLGQFEEVLEYRKLYKSMGIDWHSRRPSPEALLRRVALKKGLYAVNTCVDAYNLIVIKNRVSVGAFDYDTLEFPTVLRFPKKGETILLLGDSEPTEYKETEVAYFDQKGGFNIDFNFRDSKRTAVQLTTKNLYINVDGVFDITPKRVEQSLKETCDILIKYCGGRVTEFGIEEV